MTKKVNISEVDYDGHLESAIAAAKKDSTFADYDYEGTALAAVMRLLAMHESDLAMSANMTFFERYLKTAQLRGNVAANAVDQGYIPRGKTCAKALCTITVTDIDTDNFATAILERSTTFSGTKDGALYTFVPSETHTAQIDENGTAVFENVYLYQGEWTGQSYDINGEGIQTLEVQDQGVDIDTLEVKYVPAFNTSESYYYNRYRSVFDLGTDAAVFFLSFNRSGHYEIEFGDGVVSKKPEQGVSIVQFISTDGADGNDVSVITPVSLIAGAAGITVDVHDKSFGGSDVETIENIQLMAPLAYGARGVAVTADQYKPIVREVFPDATVKTWGGEINDPVMQGYTMICVKPKDALVLTDTEKEYLINYLNNRNVGSITPYLVDPDYLYIVVNTKVIWDTRATDDNQATLRNNVSNAVLGWSKTNLESFGDDFDLLDLATFIRDDIDDAITSNVTTVSYKRVLESVSSGVYTTSFLKTIESGSLTITGLLNASMVELTIKDNAGTLYAYNTTNDKFITSVSYGTVNYDSGVVNLSIPSQHTASELVLTANAAGDDMNLESVRTTILSISDVTVTAEEREND